MKFSQMGCAIFLLQIFVSSADAEDPSEKLVRDWTVDMTLYDDESRYAVTFQWRHQHDEAVIIETEKAGDSGKVYLPTDDPRCDGESEMVSEKDGQPFWMPRFYPRPVPIEVTEKTGIKFASVDWQPCGHKDIVICHAESHYDFHLYYKTPEELVERMPMCEIGSESNPNLPICRDSANPINHAYFNLLSRDGNIPKRAKVSTSYNEFNLQDPYSMQEREFNYCVDKTSAILQSGVHYGDSSDTLEEWKTPVTIIGSHDCELLFFEPMISWRWISNKYGYMPSWPGFKTEDLEYHNKTFQPLPTSWTIEVSHGCRDANKDDLPDNKGADNTYEDCIIKLVVEGEVCEGAACVTSPEPGCQYRAVEDEINECVSKKPYDSPFTDVEPEPTLDPNPISAVENTGDESPDGMHNEDGNPDEADVLPETPVYNDDESAGVVKKKVIRRKRKAKQGLRNVRKGKKAIRKGKNMMKAAQKRKGGKGQNKQKDP